MLPERRFPIIPCSTAWLLLTGLLLAGEFCRPRPATSQTLRNAVRRDPDLNGPSVHTFSLAGYSYRVGPDGDALRRQGRRRARRFRLPVPSDYGIEKLWYGRWGSDLLIGYEFTDGEFAGGQLVRLDGRTLKRRWTADIPGGYIGPSLAEGSSLYLTAFGFVGRLNVETGRFVWRHTHLYESRPGKQGHQFNSFRRPLLRGNRVIFIEDDGGETDAGGVALNKYLQVDKRTGRILKITRHYYGAKPF